MDKNKEEITEGFYFKVSILFLLWSLILWLLTIQTTQITVIPPEALYYARQLPIYYWIGMCVFPILLFIDANAQISGRNKILFDLSFLVLLILYLFGTPCFIYDNLRFLDSYAVVADVDYLANAQQVRLTGEWGYLSQHPGTHIFSTCLSRITNISTYVFAKYFPIYLFFSLVITCYAISYKISKKYALLAGVTFLSLAWLQEFHFAPQPFTFILYGAFWLVMTRKIEPQEKSQTSLSLLALILLASITLSHAGTPLFIQFNLFMLLVIFILIKRYKLFGDNMPSPSRVSTIFVITAVLWFAWITFISAGILSLFVNVASNAFKESVYGGISLLSVFPKNPTSDYRIVGVIRTTIGIFEFVIGSLSILFVWLNKDKYLSVIFGSWFVSCFVYAAFSLFAGGLHFGRAFYFALFPLSILVVAIFHEDRYTKWEFTKENKTGLFFTHSFKHQSQRDRLDKTMHAFKVFTIVFIFLSAFLIPMTRYCGDASEYYSDSELASRDFRVDHNIKSMAIYLPAKQIPHYHMVAFDENRFNYYQMKFQLGNEYLDYFKSKELSRVYDSKRSQLYIEKGKGL